MYDRSTRWKDNIYKNPQSFINVYIDDVLINSKYIFELKKGGTLFENDFELGSTPSQYIEFKIKKGLVENPKKVKLEYGLFYNDYQYTVDEVHNMMVSVLNNTLIKNLLPNFETIPIGIFNVDDFKDVDGKTTSIKALDDMIKLDVDDGYYDASELINKKGYATLGEIAQDICNKKGVVLGSTSFLNSEKHISVYDNEVTAREYISYIAEQAGCFAVIGRDGKLYFRKIYQDEETIPLKLFKTYKFGEEYKISKVSYEDGIRSFKFGDDTRNTLWINQENMFIVAEEQIQNVYNNIKDLTINSFEGTTIIDPAVDLGDKIIVDGKPIVFQGEMNLYGRFIADIKSTISIKAKEETTTRKTSQKVINRRVQSRIDEEEAKITLLAEQTSENEGKITQLELGLDGITATVASNKQETDEALQTTRTELETQIQVSAEGVESNVSKTLESYSTTEETNQSISNAKTEAINSANTSTDNKLKNYSTTTQMNSAITQKANEISTSVSETYVTKTDSANNISDAKSEAISTAGTNTDNKLKNYSTTTQMNSAITQKANEITSEVSTTYSTKTDTTNAINNINIGGRNLVLNSDAYLESSSTTNTSKSFQFNVDAYNQLRNKQIAMSMDIELTDVVYNSSASSSKRRVVAELVISYADGTTQYCDLWHTFSSTAETIKERISTVVQIKDKEIKEVTSKTISIYVQGLGSGTVKIGRLKVELGNKVTDWTPAPEDIENKLTTTETKVTKIEQNLDSITQSVTAIKEDTSENIVNGDFKNSFNNWETSNSGIMEITTISNIKWLHMGVYAIDVPDIIQQKITTFMTDTQYKLALIGYAENNTSVINASVEFYNSSDKLLSTKSTKFSLSTSEQSYNWDFSTPSSFEYAIFKLYAYGNPDKEMYFRNISITGGALWQRVTELQLSVDGMQSEVSEKVGNDEIISKINQSAEAVGINANKIELSANDILNLLAGNAINLGSKNITIKSDNFNVNKNGEVTINDNGEVDSGNLRVEGPISTAIIGSYALNYFDNNWEHSAILNNNQFVLSKSNDGGNTGVIGVSQRVQDDTAEIYLYNLNANTMITPDKITMNANDISIDLISKTGNSIISLSGINGNGTQITEGNITTPILVQTSLESQKKNFEKLENALEIIKNVDIYKYNLKSEKEGTKKHIGFVIGDNYNYSKELTSNNNDGADIYSLASCCLKAIQEQQEEIEQLKAKVKEMEEK